MMKKIKDYPRYSISKDGRIYSHISRSYMKLVVNRRDGYYRVSLYKDSVRNRKMVHRLVAETYLDNPENLKYVNHKDGNKLNNNLDNLEWCTHSDNLKHAYSLDLITRNGGRKPK